jgi:hypothetical protein
MKISDIFRKLADVIDQEQNPGAPDPQLQNPAVLAAVDAGPYGDGVEAPDNTDAGADDDVFVPPLQLKLELLKRAVGVDNIYDEGEPRADDVEQPHDHHEHHHMDELARMKQLAAINMIGDDEPLDD